jgi:hypothetical protein
MASSSVIFRGGCKNTFSSAAVVRMFVSFFSRTGLTCDFTAFNVTQLEGHATHLERHRQHSAQHQSDVI